MIYLVLFLFFQEFENSKAVLEQKMADLQSELEEARNGQKDLKEPFLSLHFEKGDACSSQ